jgi:meiosis-specific transcription factor NDT80
MGSRLSADMNSATNYPINRQGFPPLVSHDQDLPNYAPFNPPSRQLGSFANTYQPQIQSYNPTLAGNASVALDQGSRGSNMSAQEGPPFEDTKSIYPVITARNQQVTPKIDAKIQKGFFKVDHKWTCYRRNYFTVSCSFSLKPTTYETQFYLQRHANQQAEPIKAFAVQISAKTAAVNNQESEVRNLVQHTPKRDKATETIPGKVLVQPAQPSTLANTGAYHGSGVVYGAGPNVPPSLMIDYNTQPYSSAPHQSPPQSHTFERIQFQKATANNGKRRAQQQYFHVVVELFADVGRHQDTQWVKIATAQSHPMVVRGRSPGHYKDNRRDSATSMDPDRGAGAGGDGPGGAPSMSSYLGSSHPRSSTMDWESAHRGSSQMGGSYRQPIATCSPTSTTSVDSSSTSCDELDYGFLQPKQRGAITISNLASPDITTAGSVGQISFSPLIDLRPHFSSGESELHDHRNRFCMNRGAAERLDTAPRTMYRSNQITPKTIQSPQAMCSS